MVLKKWARGTSNGAKHSPRARPAQAVPPLEPPKGLDGALSAIEELQGLVADDGKPLAPTLLLPDAARNCLVAVSERSLPKRIATLPVEVPDALVEKHAQAMGAKCMRCANILREKYAMMEENALGTKLANDDSIDGKAFALICCARKSPRFLWLQLQQGHNTAELAQLFATALSAKKPWPNPLELDLMNAQCSREIQMQYKNAQERSTITGMHCKAQDCINQVNDYSMEILRNHFVRGGCSLKELARCGPRVHPAVPTPARPCISCTRAMTALSEESVRLTHPCPCWRPRSGRECDGRQENLEQPTKILLKMHEALEQSNDPDGAVQAFYPLTVDEQDQLACAVRYVREASDFQTAQSGLFMWMHSMSIFAHSVAHRWDQQRVRVAADEEAVTLELQRLLALPLLHQLLAEQKPLDALPSPKRSSRGRRDQSAAMDGSGASMATGADGSAQMGDGAEDDEDGEGEEEDELGELDMIDDVDSEDEVSDQLGGGEGHGDENDGEDDECDDGEEGGEGEQAGDASTVVVDEWKEVSKKRSKPKTRGENATDTAPPAAISPPAFDSAPPVFSSATSTARSNEPYVWGAMSAGGGGRAAAPASIAPVASRTWTATPSFADEQACKLWMGHIPRYMDDVKLKERVGRIGSVRKIFIMESKVRLPPPCCAPATRLGGTHHLRAPLPACGIVLDT